MKDSLVNYYIDQVGMALSACADVIKDVRLAIADGMDDDTANNPLINQLGLVECTLESLQDTLVRLDERISDTMVLKESAQNGTQDG